MDGTGILADLATHWHVYLTMPFIAALIGYLTKRVFGWQGVIPANARRMATTAVDLLTKNLLDPREVFARPVPEEMLKELEPPLLKAVDHVTRCGGCSRRAPSNCSSTRSARRRPRS